MAGGPDRHARFSEETLASLAGVKRDTRRGWAERGLLRIAPRGQRYDVDDAVELVVFVALYRQLGFDDALHAWQGVRDGLRPRAPAGPLFIVYDEEEKVASLETSLAAVGRGVLGGRRCRALELRAGISDVRRTCARMTKTRKRHQRPRPKAKR
jgi:hypothetical protein